MIAWLFDIEVKMLILLSTISVITSCMGSTIPVYPNILLRGVLILTYETIIGVSIFDYRLVHLIIQSTIAL